MWCSKLIIIIQYFFYCNVARFQASEHQYTNTTGTYNDTFGFGAGESITTASGNTCMGAKALGSVTTGTYNTALGIHAGNYSTQLTTGDSNIYVGGYTIASDADAHYEYVFGYNHTGKGTNTCMIGGSNGVYNHGNTTAWQTTSDERIKKDLSGYFKRKNSSIFSDFF